MIEGQFSRTALTAAGFRAAHQVVDGASVLEDPLAALVLGEDRDALIAHGGEAALRPLRLFVALRSRIAEDVAKRAIAKGARQVVILGAGLDTFAWRAAPAPGLRFFEVDHPSTQAEKRRRFASVGVVAPPHLVFAPCDFERQSLPESLAAVGFDTGERAAFIWLGVTPYLTAEAIDATLRFVASVAAADLVFDYANPSSSITSAGRRLFQERMAALVAEMGETFRSYFETSELRERLRGMGFTDVDDWGPQKIAARFRSPTPPSSDEGGHILHAFFRRG